DIIKFSDKKEDLSGDYIENELKKRYTVKSREIIKDEKDDLLKSIDEMINNNVDVILTNGGTGLSERDITVESVEKLFDKKIDGFGEIFRHQSYIEIGSGALLSRATAGVYKKCCIFSMPGSPNAVKTALNIIIDELPHIVHHAKK
ncbi:MAG: MogA/MoaB family molybdenum cofactor biosynthesis protein, partial [Methanobrevibacter sp.]|nr:MogA/MoaB family molybdenum cofactor biosynthesis protein [Methanobrevibacter sp.]